MVRSRSVLVIGGCIAVALVAPTSAGAADTAGACVPGTMLVEGECVPETPAPHPPSPVPHGDVPGTDQITETIVAPPPPEAVAGAAATPTDAVSSAVATPTGSLPFTGMSTSFVTLVGGLLVMVGIALHGLPSRPRRVRARS